MGTFRLENECSILNLSVVSIHKKISNIYCNSLACPGLSFLSKSLFNPSVSVRALMTLIEFTLSNARRLNFYSSMGTPSDTEGLTAPKTH